MKEKKNNKKLVIIVAIVLLLSLVGFTLAYFVGQIGSGATANVNITTATVDTLTFSTGADVSIGPVTQQNFAEGQPNQSGSTTASAQLRANSTTNSATETYNLYVNITNNTFHKTSDNAELILTITNPAGNPVTSLTGLTYTTVKGVSGFDVTEKTGLIQIASDYTITVPNQANNPKTDTWNITLTFVNLDSDQTDNAGASFSAQAIIQKEVYTIAKYWNDGFSGRQYQSGTTPSTTFSTPLELLQNEAYIKTTDKNEACLYYNNHEFCYTPDFWDTDGATTKAKLQSEMEAAFGTTADNCSSYTFTAECIFGSLKAFVNTGAVVVHIGLNSNYFCQITSNDNAICAFSPD